jgi:hypothetical protein
LTNKSGVQKPLKNGAKPKSHMSRLNLYYDVMQKIGIYLILFGIGSMILNSYGFEFKILMWLGEGYTSRLTIVGIGLLLVLLGSIKKESEEDSQEE